MNGRMSRTIAFFVLVFPAFSLAETTSRIAGAVLNPTTPWRAVHVMTGSAKSLAAVENQVPELAKLGVNVLVCEVDYGFEFQSHPEVRSHGGITKEIARKFAAACRAAGIKVIPQINCLGHQSWAKVTGELLTAHPEFDETPGQYPGNKGIYCRSWCPLHPQVNAMVFDLMDEMIDAFEADAFHVGMDEVFLIGSDHCTRCKGQDKAKLFAKAVTDLHDHLKAKGVQMLMWADRLIDGKATGLGEWEASINGTAAAADLIPKDIILCPWHYEKRKEYLSIPMFLKKGFRILPAGWKKADAVDALIDYCVAQKSPNMLGYIATTWSTSSGKLAQLAPLVRGIQRIQEKGGAIPMKVQQ